MVEKRILALILTLYILLGLIYAVTTPAFEASDELWHYPMIRHLADGNPLPAQVFDPQLAGPWHQQASQPPLYYYLGAALTFWIDTSDMPRTRWLNPHVDNGVITADGNINLVIHDPAANPWQGTLLAIRIVRMASVLLGAVTVFLTYQIARSVAPGRPEIALGAAAVNAFMPMFLFISGAVNNDNLVIPLASLAIWLMIRLAEQPGRHRDAEKGGRGEWGWLVGLGIVMGLAALTKISGIGLIPLAFGAIFISRWQASERHVTVAGLVRLLAETLGRWLVVLIPVLLIAGWWYYRNWILYGDWTGWNAFIAVLGQRPQPASLGQLWSERSGFMASYWGLFGGLNIAMATWIYHLLNGVLLTAVAGFVVYLIQEMRKWLRAREQDPAIHLKHPLAQLFDFAGHYLPIVLCLLWSTAVVYGLIQWTTITWSSQGRLVFTAVSTLTTLLAIGLVGWLSRKAATAVIGGLGLFLFVIAAAAPFVWIRPAYQPNRYTHHWLVPTQVNAIFGDQIRLVGYEANRTWPINAHAAVQPGGKLDLLLEWEVLAPMDRDWSVFVHLNDPVLGAPIAQRDMYLDHGLRPTSLLQPGERIFNRYLLPIPDTAVAPADLTLAVGLYDYDTEERLPHRDGRDAALLAIIPLTTREGNFPNPVSENFGNELELVGFQVEPRRTYPGDTMEVVLYLRPLRPLRTDYAFFAQVVDLDGDLTRWASDDIPAQASGTATWPVGAVQTLTLSLPVSENTPPAIYPLIIGVYTHTAEDGFKRLQWVTPDGRVTDQDFLRLTQIRVDG